MKTIFFLTFLLIVPMSLLNAQVLDQSFGTEGKVVTELSQSVDGIYKTVLQSDGKIIAVGVGNGFLTVIRYLNNGSLDTAFGNQGKVTSMIRNSFNFLGGNADIKIQSDGKIILLGLNVVSNSVQATLARYTSNGTLDTTFGTNGIVNLHALFPFNSSTVADAMEFLPDGKLLVTACNQFNEMYLIRLNANGSPDSSFGTNGIVTTVVPDGYYAPFYASNLCIQPNGNILVAADIGIAGTNNIDFSLFQFNADGTLNTSFGSNGFVVTDMGANEDLTRTIKLQPDGKILLSGSSNNKYAVVRYTANGVLDTTFNTTGKALTTVGSNSFCTDMLLEPDGKILLTGNIIHDFGVVRYNSNGTLDTTFGNNGKYLIDFGSSYDYGRSMAKQIDGKYVIGGTTSYFCSNRAFALIQFSLPNLEVAYSERNTVTLYPNPSYDFLNIDSKKDIQSVTIYAINGQLVAHQSVNALSTCIDVTHLSRGIHLAKIQTDAGITTYKISKE